MDRAVANAYVYNNKNTYSLIYVWECTWQRYRNNLKAQQLYLKTLEANNCNHWFSSHKLQIRAKLVVGTSCLWAEQWQPVVDIVRQKTECPIEGHPTSPNMQVWLCVFSIVGRQQKKYGCLTCVYLFSMHNKKVSTESVYEEKKCLVKLGKVNYYHFK